MKVLEVSVFSLGRVEYAACTLMQREYQEQVVLGEKPSALMFVEHPSVLTLGAAFHEKNLLYDRKFYASRGIAIEETDRGGDVTYHGPGQLVCYPIIDISRTGKDLHQFIRQLERVFIIAAAAFGVEAEATKVHTGIWADGKILGSIGIKVRKWVSMHGVSFNCNDDLTPFGLIVPCGLNATRATSLSQLCGRDISPEEAQPAVMKGFEKVFGFVLEEKQWQSHS